MEKLEQEPEVVCDVEDTEYEIDPSVRLRSGIDLTELRQGEGTEFEVEQDSDKFESTDYFDRENVYKQMNLAATCGDDDESSGDDDTLTPFDKLARKMKDLTQDGTGNVKKRILRHGAGEVVPPNCYVRVHYNGYLEYSDEPYDSTRLRNRVHGFRLGKGEVIPGLDIAVSTMKKGEEAQFLIAPDYGYKDIGCPPRIPPNANLLFVVELLTFIDKEGVDEYYSLTSEEKRNAGWDVISKVVRESKDKAKSFFERENYRMAKNSYQQAAALLEQCRLQDAEEERKQQEASVKVYLNIAVCFSKLAEASLCMTFCRQVLEIEQNNVKALFLMGKSANRKNDFPKAKRFLERAHRLKPNCKEINEELKKLERNIQSFSLMEKKMCQRMFSQASHQMEEALSGKCATQQPTTTQECSTEFKQIVTDNLRKFKEDANQCEMPFAVGQYSAAELGCLVETAHGLGLKYKETQEGSTLYLTILKS